MEDFIMKRRTKQEMQNAHRQTAKMRLNRLRLFRSAPGTPKIIIKREQIGLCLNRQGLQFDQRSMKYEELFNKYIRPLLLEE